MSDTLLLARLPAIDPAEAELRRQLLTALNGRVWTRGPLTAKIALRTPEAGPWFVCENGCAFHLADAPIRRAEGDFDGIDAAAALEAGESALADVEAALGVDLAPTSLLAKLPGDALVVIFHAGGERMLLAWPPALPLVPAPPPAFVPALAASVALPLTITFAGPKLPPHDAAELTQGDLLLLGQAPFGGATAAGDWQAGIVFDPFRRTVRLLSHGIHQTETPMDDPTHSPASAPMVESANPIPVDADFAVPLTIELESSVVPLRQLQALCEGAVLPLEGGGRLSVLIRASGQRLARGHIVSVGGGFGVLIEARQEG